MSQGTPPPLPMTTQCSKHKSTNMCYMHVRTGTYVNGNGNAAVDLDVDVYM